MAAFPVNAALTGKAALLRYTNRYFLPEGRAALAPTRENVARVIAEKDAALAAMDAACPVHDERFRWLRAQLVVSRAACRRRVGRRGAVAA